MISPNLPYWGIKHHLITRKQSGSEKAIFLNFFWNSWSRSIILANAALTLFNSIPQSHNIYTVSLWLVSASFFPFSFRKFQFSWFPEKPGLSNEETNAFSKFYYVYKKYHKIQFIIVTLVQVMFFHSQVGSSVIIYQLLLFVSYYIIIIIILLLSFISYYIIINFVIIYQFCWDRSLKVCHPLFICPWLWFATWS